MANIYQYCEDIPTHMISSYKKTKDIVSDQPDLIISLFCFPGFCISWIASVCYYSYFQSGSFNFFEAIFGIFWGILWGIGAAMILAVVGKIVGPLFTHFLPYFKKQKNDFKIVEKELADYLTNTENQYKILISISKIPEQLTLNDKTNLKHHQEKLDQTIKNLKASFIKNSFTSIISAISDFNQTTHAYMHDYNEEQKIIDFEQAISNYKKENLNEFLSIDENNKEMNSSYKQLL